MPTKTADPRLPAGTNHPASSKSANRFTQMLHDMLDKTLGSSNPFESVSAPAPVLTHISYSLCNTRTSRDLQRLQFQFECSSNNAKNHPLFAYNIVRFYVQKLDAVFEKMTEGTRQQVINEDLYDYELGYEYEGKFLSLSDSALESCARQLFGLSQVPPHRPPSPYSTMSATVQSTHPQPDKVRPATYVSVTLHLQHMLNCCFLRYTPTIEALQFRPAAQRTIGELDALLTGQSEPGLEELFAMVPR